MVLRWDVPQRGPCHHVIVPQPPAAAASQVLPGIPSMQQIELLHETVQAIWRDMETMLIWVDCTGHLQGPPSPPPIVVICNLSLSFFLFLFYFFAAWCGFSTSFRVSFISLLGAAPSGFVAPFALPLGNSSQRAASSPSPLNHSQPFQIKGKYLSSLKMFA